MKIWNVPIEDLEIRYSSQWNRWFPEYFAQHSIKHAMIPGTRLTDTIEQGSFLDVCGTNYFKATQLRTICELIYKGRVSDEDVFLFHDIWFPGIEMLAYMRDGLGAKFRIAGCLHAGSYDPHDFLHKKGMHHWGKFLENSWFRLVDMIFVATRFHKDLVMATRLVDPDKIHVTGFPIYPPIQQTKLSVCEKRLYVVFPHRLDYEKQPCVFDSIIEATGLPAFKTMEYWKDKESYYRQLNMSRVAVSCALQETWGIAMQEAVFCRCVPVVPNRLSYPELYPEVCLYSTIQEAEEKTRYFYNSYFEESTQVLLDEIGKRLEEKGASAIRNMVGELVRTKERI